VYAYELKDSNISGFSPLKLTTCSTAQAIIARLTAGDFDPVQEGIVQENISPALTPADHRKFIWGKNKVIVKADAPGMCLLVLPLQYSHCLALKSPTGGRVNARLVRVDLALTGILFSRTLDAVIVPNYGPFSNVFAKFKDYSELKNLQLK
jgi:hypothetical protein